MSLQVERLEGLLKAKGLAEKDLGAEFGRARAHSWLSGTRSPRADDVGFRLAKWLEVPVGYLGYLYGQPSDLDALSFEEVAARGSLELFLEQEGQKVPRDLHQLYFSFVKSPVAPRTVEGWRALSKDIVEPSFEFAIRRQQVLRRMTKSAKAMRKGSAAWPSSGQPGSPSA